MERITEILEQFLEELREIKMALAQINETVCDAVYDDEEKIVVPIAEA